MTPPLFIEGSASETTGPWRKGTCCQTALIAPLASACSRVILSTFLFLENHCLWILLANISCIFLIFMFYIYKSIYCRWLVIQRFPDFPSRNIIFNIFQWNNAYNICKYVCVTLLLICGCYVECVTFISKIGFVWATNTINV